jgi:23S rRNA (uracil1939-C5)-methyltransferase
MDADGAIAVRIHGLTHEGHGVADVDGKRVFVPGALPAEQVLIRTHRRRRRYADAELVDIVDASQSRVPAHCDYFGRCGGCALQHMSYAAQIEFKENAVRDALVRIGGVEPRLWLEPVTGPQWNYRRRARLGVKHVDGKGRVLVGFRERAAPLITDMRRCPVLVPPFDSAIGDLADTIATTSVKRRLPQAEIAVGDDRGAIVLRVLDAPTASDCEAFRRFGQRHDVDVHLQPGGPGSAAPLDPVEPLSYRLDDYGLRLQFAPTDFIQVNATINAKLVAAVVGYARREHSERVLDLYCGLGNFSLSLAAHAGSVLGVEGEAGLVARAARNAELNGIINAAFLTADLMQDGWSFLREPWDLVVLDPPRTGAQAAVAQMNRMRPKRIVYVSCHPATLARDARTLVESHGYRLSEAGIFDMFPNTYHVEVMACFERG